MKKLFYTLLVVALIIGCGKEEELTENQKLSSLEGKKWVIDEVIIDSVDVTDNIESCVLDNERIFYVDNTYEITEGDTACTGREDVSAMGTWQFNDVKTTIKVAIDSDTTEYIIRELYKNRMRLFFIDQSTGNNVNWKLVTK